MHDIVQSQIGSESFNKQVLKGNGWIFRGDSSVSEMFLHPLSLPCGLKSTGPSSFLLKLTIFRSGKVYRIANRRVGKLSPS